MSLQGRAWALRIIIGYNAAAIMFVTGAVFLAATKTGTAGGVGTIIGFLFLTLAAALGFVIYTLHKAWRRDNPGKGLLR